MTLKKKKEKEKKIKFECFLQQFLTTKQIEQIIAKTDKKIKRFFLGAFATGVLPDLTQKKRKNVGAFGTLTIPQNCEHWVAIFKNKFFF